MRMELYGVLTEAAGTTRLELPAPTEGTVAAALDAAADACPELASHLPQVAVAMGDTLVPQDTPVNEDSTLILLPPVSGG
ncbi:MoaD/ThiS family protein [Halorhodospira halophila]|uniref:ThiamineS protein n=1 Tax=Halorhodospira halophila (strain DSM 244 / SL1) TaxID=349124 RepID=A1WW87_HALHL|nr:MoaD/ThiS family protein [Halorhodospira halophila]ABM61949.1 thiamineS protein [Halorhodospira halophila SL1]MBK1729723.1 hypothetical protein [Halorhodospira halophila]